MLGVSPTVLRRPGIEHPIDLMLACHERIRRFLGGARRLADVEDRHDPQAPAAAAAAARYFREGVPLHALDEDASLAPRLRPLASGEIRRALDAVADQHEAIHAAIDALLEALDPIAAGGPVPDSLHDRVEALAELFEPHLALEEELVFPAARQLLPPESCADIRLEMMARRRAV